MGRPLAKGLAVVAVGIGALGISYIGYRTDKTHQYEQRVQYANSTIAKEQEQLADITKTIDSFYQEGQVVFLRDDLEETELAAVRGKLESVKVTAEAFQVQADDLDKEAETIQETKETLMKKIDLTEDKLTIQEKTNSLFESAVKSWQDPVNDVVIKAETSDETIGEIREDLKLMMLDDPWQKNITEYLDFANAQLTRIKDIQTTIDSLLKDGQITDQANYESFIALAESISQVRNTVKKAEFTSSLNTISEQLGYGSVSSNDSESEETSSDEGYDEDTATEEYAEDDEG
ncbi:hypothetical protein [Enterococcus sp.]|uniref:hypothetical protein n=1 Tax=Enterococcus sp. TaxID=35783 RepID=UPI003C719DEC